MYQYYVFIHGDFITKEQMVYKVNVLCVYTWWFYHQGTNGIHGDFITKEQMVVYKDLKQLIYASPVCSSTKNVKTLF